MKLTPRHLEVLCVCKAAHPMPMCLEERAKEMQLHGFIGPNVDGWHKLTEMGNSLLEAMCEIMDEPGIVVDPKGKRIRIPRAQPVPGLALAMAPDPNPAIADHMQRMLAAAETQSVSMQLIANSLADQQVMLGKLIETIQNRSINQPCDFAVSGAIDRLAQEIRNSNNSKAPF